MPLWKLHVPEGDFSAKDKEALGGRIADIYDHYKQPRFYTSVVFQDYDPDSFWVGGERRGKFVQVEVVHAARTGKAQAEHDASSVKTIREGFLALAIEALRPYVADRGYEWEFHVEEAPRSMWMIDGMTPPPSWSDAEKKWGKDNKSSPYEAAEPSR